MIVSHVAPHLDEEASGLYYSISRLCSTTAALGVDTRLLCLSQAHALDGVQSACHPGSGDGFGHSSALWRALGEAAQASDVLHNHGLWTFPNMACGWPGRRGRAALMTSPHGMLAPGALRISRWKKRLAWPLQRGSVYSADCLHATSALEARELRELGLRQPIAVVGIGIEVPPEARPWPAAAGPRRLLFLSRIHPKKGLEMLLAAWQSLMLAYPDWELLIVGKGDDAYVAELRALAERLALRRVEFRGPAYGGDKAALYRSADLFVLPTFSENFGIVVTEALSHGVPVLTTTETPWTGLVEHGCGWWVAPRTDALQAALADALRQPPARLQAMGLAGRAWMIESFAWAPVARQMTRVYQWLARGGAAPDCVQTLP